MSVDSAAFNDQPPVMDASSGAEATEAVANDDLGKPVKPAISPIRMPTEDNRMATEDNGADQVETGANADGELELGIAEDQQVPTVTPGSPVPDQPEQLADLFRDARYFMVKSSNYENVSLAKVKGVWATPPPNEHRLNGAYHNSRSVYLIFSVKESGRFQGYARLAGPSEKTGSRDRVNWVLPPGLSHRALSGTFRIDWISRRELRFGKTGHLLNAWNEFKPVKIGRDGQEIEPGVGEALCRLFHVDPECDLNRLVERTRSRRRINVPSGPPQHQNPQHHYQQQPPPMLPQMPPGHVVPPPQQFMQLDQQQQYHQQVPPPNIPLHHHQQQQRASSRDRHRDRERDRERDRRRDHRDHREPAPSSSSSSRHRRRSSGRRSSSRRRSRSPAGHRGRGGDRHCSAGRDRRRSGSRNRDRSNAGNGNGANVSSNFQGVGKETFINGSYQDYLKQFGSAAVGQPEQASQQQQPYQQYTAAYGYQYAAAANPYAMMYGQQYMMPGQQHPMYGYPQQQQQYMQQLQYQQQPQPQQQPLPELSMKDYEQRVNEFIQRTTNAAPASTAASAGVAEAAASRDDSSSSSGEEATGGGRRRRRRSSSSSSSGR